MSGLLRNLIAFLLGIFQYGRSDFERGTQRNFWVTPFDTGVKNLKSDRFLQLAETAQIDFMLKTGLFFKLLGLGVSFVNLSQVVKFLRPVKAFSKVKVFTGVVYADDKCAYFSHVIVSGENIAAEVLVKMKFKKGAKTLPPREFISIKFEQAPAKIELLESYLSIANA